MNDLLKNMPDEAAALHRLAKKMVSENSSEDEIINALQAEGADKAYAALILDNVQEDMRNAKDFFKLLILAAFVTVAALLLTCMSYRFALRTGASFFLLFWGLVVAAVLMAIRARGIYKMLPRDYFKK